MITPQIVTGTAIVYSHNDAACDRTKVDGAIPWLLDHHLSCGTKAPPTIDGETLSRFEVRLLEPGAAITLPLDDDAASGLAWYAATIVSLDDATDRQLLIDGVDLVICIEVGHYARRLNVEIRRPFLKKLLQASSPTAAGSNDSTPTPSRPKGGTRRRTRRHTTAPT
jgi:hypothetical protein